MSVDEISQLLVPGADGRPTRLDELTPIVYAELAGWSHRYCDASAPTTTFRQARWSMRPTSASWITSGCSGRIGPFLRRIRAVDAPYSGRARTTS